MVNTYSDFDISFSKKESLSRRKINIRIDKSVWTSLKGLKRPNETFNDVILNLLNERSKKLSNSKFGMIKYGRKTDFSRIDDFVGVQYEYNDIKSISDFTIDLKIKKVFFGKKVYNPGEFFGIESKFFYISKIYFLIYLLIITKILLKEFKVKISSVVQKNDLENILLWKQLYYDYGLSEESFKEDIEEVFRKSDDVDLKKHFEKQINNSPSQLLNRIK